MNPYQSPQTEAEEGYTIFELIEDVGEVAKAAFGVFWFIFIAYLLIAGFSLMVPLMLRELISLLFKITFL